MFSVLDLNDVALELEKNKALSLLVSMSMSLVERLSVLMMGIIIFFLFFM